MRRTLVNTSRCAMRPTRRRSMRSSSPFSRWRGRIFRRTCWIQSSFMPTPRSTTSQISRYLSMDPTWPTFKPLGIAASRRVCMLLLRSSSRASTITRRLPSATSTSRNIARPSLRRRRRTTCPPGSRCALRALRQRSSALPQPAVLRSSSTPTMWTMLSPTTQTLDTLISSFHSLSRDSAWKMPILASSPSSESSTPSMSLRRSWSTARCSSVSSTCPRSCVPVNAPDCGALLFTFTWLISRRTMR
mmetsp:Transcript_57677/g.122372  ORF Transcript_57677/g.122372 Transcript_57677/m.122372 type:complete len:246 (-) Transcript_57677:1109-1846(-)